jgi:hypothetical protein
VFAVYIQALPFELVHGHSIVLLFRGRVQPVFELDLLNDYLPAVERNFEAAFALDEVIISLPFRYDVSGRHWGHLSPRPDKFDDLAAIADADLDF